jgi:hypothetical protein
VPRFRDTAGDEGAARYFFLSYPRLPPLPAVDDIEVADLPDQWVRGFYRDVTTALRECAAGTASLRPGFLDTRRPADLAWKAALIEALSTAKTFVPLLSPEYVRRSWPRRERASFVRRLTAAGVPDPQRRVMPVLWVPVPVAERPPELAEALTLATGAALSAYTENGLLAMSRITSHHAGYWPIVRALAARIAARAAEGSVGTSAAVDPGLLDSPVGQETRGPVFAVIAASAASTETSFAEYALLVAERLGFAVLRPELRDAMDALVRMPGVIIIDSAAITDACAVGALGEILGTLPSWVLPVLLAGPDRAPYLDAVRATIEKTYATHKYQPDVVRRGLRGVGSLREFVRLMPFLVARAEREYLRHGPVRRPPPRTGFRPRLASSERPVYMSIKETPDA